MFSNSLKASSLALAMGLALASSTAYAGGDRIECDADSANGLTSMDARFESETKDGVTREKFSTSFEAAPGGAHAAGHVLEVNVSGAIVGTMTLVAQPNGDLGGDSDFDTNLDRDAADTDTPFPANWPGAEAGTVVLVGTLGCSLQD